MSMTLLALTRSAALLGISSGLCATVAIAQQSDSTRVPPMIAPQTPAAAPEFGPPRPPAPPPRAMRVAFTDSMKEPESVHYDADQDVYFVSNINGPSLAKDGNGFISRLKSDGTIDQLHWVQSGRNGVTLNAPKGIVLVADTLWVADIDFVRGFNRRTGAPVANIDLSGKGAVFLNDAAVGPDGAVYVTDTELKPDARGNMTHPNTDRILRIAPNRATSIALESDRLQRPNGIIWDTRNNRFIVVPLGGDTVVTWRPGQTQPTPLVTGPGQFDGVIVTRDGSLFVCSQATSSVDILVGNRLVPAIENVEGCADIGYDAKHDRIAVPLITQNRVAFYEVPRVPRVAEKR